MANPFSALFGRGKKETRSSIGLVLGGSGDDFVCPGYTSLASNPEIMTGCRRIAELIGSITIYLMSNTERGDVRIVNELSRLIDIEPMPNMTRSTWVQAVVMNLLLYGRGNSIVIPHTRAGYLRRLEPITSGRVSFLPIGYEDYKVLIDGKSYDPEKVLHFTYNPDRTYLWKGQGVTVSLRAIADNLKQAEVTTNGFLKSKWKPSVIIKVDGFTEEFSTPAGRSKLLEDYVAQETAGQPWVIPAEQFQVEQIRPLSLADLAISDSVEIDKRTIAAVLGVPAFLLGVGDYSASAWNAFVQNTVRPIALGIAQEMTKKLITSPSWYLRFNTLSLMDWDLSTIASVFGALSDRGIVDGNEVRDRIGMSPRDGLDELRVLENYIPADMTGKQKKLIQDGEE